MQLDASQGPDAKTSYPRTPNSLNPQTPLAILLILKSTGINNTADGRNPALPIIRNTP